jgi:2-keto-3-deoxy-L-rhamnonate aldolase RhmA
MVPDSFTNHLKRKLAAGQPVNGLWVTLESPTVTEIAVLLKLDFVVIDTEHGALDYSEVLNHLRAIGNSTTTPLVRIPRIDQGIIKRVFDLGAGGIIVPQVNSAEEVAEAVRFAKYPPWGVRGVGGERATHWGMALKDYTASANDETLVIPLLETVSGGQALDEMLAVRGVDAVWFGPADYSASAGYLGQWEGPGIAEKLLEFKNRVRARGLPCGILGTDFNDARMRRDQGFQMIGLGSDAGLLARTIAAGLALLQ